MSDAVTNISNLRFPDLVSSVIVGSVGMIGIGSVWPSVLVYMNVTPDSWTGWITGALILVAAYWFGRVVSIALVGRA